MVLRKYGRQLIVIMSILIVSAVLTGCAQNSRENLISGDFGTIEKKAVTLLSPEDKARKRSSEKLNFLWTSRTGVIKYTFQLASDADFNDVIVDKELTETDYTFNTSDLKSGDSINPGRYYFRVSFKAGDSEYVSQTRTVFVYDDNLYVNGSYSGSEKNGLQDTPYTSITDALNAADVIRGGNADTALNVRVAAGTYTEAVVLKPGISLYGGYNATDWNRDISANLTKIKGDYEMAVSAGENITTDYTSTTIVDGFTLESADNSSRRTAVLLNKASPTISNNKILAVSDVAIDNIGLNIIDSNAVIKNNLVNPSTGNNFASSASSKAVNISGSGMVKLINNNLIGGISTYAYGVYLKGSTKPKIYNNTIIGNPAGGGINARGISLNDSSEPEIKNNIIHCGLNDDSTGTYSTYCIRENSTSTAPSVIYNNLFLFTITLRNKQYIYHDRLSDCNTNNDGDNNAQSCNHEDINAWSNGSGNIQLTDHDLVFVDFDGADNDVITHADNDWSLKTADGTICNVIYGGLDLSTEFTTDFAGTTRSAALPGGSPCSTSNTGAAGWSMGAYEGE